MADGSWERELQQIRDNLRQQAQTLDMPGLRMASEYFTPEEMVGKGAEGRQRGRGKREPQGSGKELLAQGS